MDTAGHVLPPTVARVVEAVNRHDLAALVRCFADDYTNRTPVHPLRGFTGSDQVRRNWTRIFTGVPDVRARVPRSTTDGPTVWTEWEMTGTRRDSTPFLMRGVIIFEIAGDRIESATFYLEPVEQAGGDVDAAVSRVVGDTTPQKEMS